MTYSVTTITASRPSDSLTNQMIDTAVENQMAESNNSSVENQVTDQVRDASLISNEIPAALTTSLYYDHYKWMNNEELKRKSERVFCTMSISVRDAKTIQRATIMQQSCEQWREQWNGCIIASMFHGVYVCKESTHPGPLLKWIDNEI